MVEDITATTTLIIQLPMSIEEVISTSTETGRTLDGV
jgi:hypothetical protein